MSRSQVRSAERPSSRSLLTALDRWIVVVYALWLALVCICLFVALHLLEPHLSLHDGFRTVVVNSDAGWLREIDIFGYRWSGNPNVTSDIAFLPLYPLVVRAIHALGLGWNGAAFLVSVLCQGVTLILLGRLLAESGATSRQTKWAIGFALVYPAALFAVTGFGTTMLGMCVVAALYAYRRGHRTLAFAFAGAATGLYYTGVAVPVALVVAELRTRGLRAVASVPGLARIVLGLSGLLGFMAYLWVRFDNPLASIQDQRAWTGTASIGSVLWHAVTLSPVADGILGYIGQRQEANLSHALDAPFLLALVVAAVWLMCGRHSIETWLLVAGGALILYNSAKAGYPFSVIRLAYPFFIVLPANPRVRTLMSRVTWSVPYLGCLAISGYWVTILARRLFTD
jgi:hypothetical protein